MQRWAFLPSPPIRKSTKCRDVSSRTFEAKTAVRQGAWMHAHSWDISHATTLISARHIFSQVVQNCSRRALSALYEMSRTFCLPKSLILEIPAAIFWPISARFSVQQRVFQRDICVLPFLAFFFLHSQRRGMPRIDGWEKPKKEET